MVSKVRSEVYFMSVLYTYALNERHLKIPKEKRIKGIDRFSELRHLELGIVDGTNFFSDTVGGVGQGTSPFQVK